MNRWPSKPLGEIARVEWGNTSVTKAFYVGAGFSAFSATGEDGFLPFYEHDEDGIVLSAIGANCGKCFRAKGRWTAIKNTITITKPAPSICLVPYLFYVLNNEDLWPKRGGGQPFISQGDARKVAVPLPPLAEQERIVKLLDEADELRKLRAQADRRTADFIPALFHEMFGDNYALPRERLEKLCERVTVGHVGPMSTEYCETGIPFLRGQNIKRGFIDLSDVLFVSERFHRRLEKSAITSGDVVSVRTGKPGTTAVVPSSLKVANCADLIVITCGPRLHPVFLCELLNQRLGDQDKLAGTTGIAQLHFNIGEARRLELAAPPLPLQNQFAQQVAEIRELEAEQAASRCRLEDLFQSLLHGAFNGEL